MRQLNTRQAVLERGSIDASARTVRASLSSETPVVRGGEAEVLRHDAESVDLSRAVDGLPMLFAHDRAAPIGIVEEVHLESRRLVGTLRFGNSSRATDVWTDVESGVLRNVSITYSVDAVESTEGGYIATRWTPYEASIVSVPADYTVGVGRSSSMTTQGNTMSDPAATANQATTQTRAQTIEEIREMGRRAHLPQGFIDNLVSVGVSRDAAGAAIINEMARRDEQLGGHLNVIGAGSRPQAGEQLGERELMVAALAERMGGPKAKPENPYRNARLAEMQRALLELRGVRTAQLTTPQLFERDAYGTHTTGDFPELLQGAGNRTLRNAYSLAQGGMLRVCRPSTVRDFRAKQLLALGEAPALLQVNEAGEFKSGSMAELKSAYTIGTFGRIFTISRQALINDDLDAFGELTMRYGRAAAQFESQFIVNLVTGNPTMADGLAVFHASHGNLGTGAPSALSQTALTAARKAMRLQKGIDGTTAIDAAPKFLIVPAALETTGEQLLTSIQPTTAADVNPFAGRLELIVDPRLDAVSSTAWYLASDPGTIDTIEYSYLEGASGPEMFVEVGFEIDGTSMKVRLDFGAGIIDYRGLYKANGA